MITREQCRGCNDDFYNQTSNSEAGRCWGARTGVMITRFKIDTATAPTEPGAFEEVARPSCFKQRGFALYEALPDFAVGTRKEVVTVTRSINPRGSVITLYFTAPESYTGRTAPGKGDGPLYLDEAEARAESAKENADMDRRNSVCARLAVYCAEVRHMEVTGRWTSDAAAADRDDGDDPNDAGWRSLR